MKFAVAALLATSSAIQIRNKATGGCLSQGETDEGFHMADTNGNGSLSYDEIKHALEAVAEHYHYTPTEADWAWVKKTGAAIDTHNPGKVDEGEFHDFANAVAEHFHLCPAGLAEVEVQADCLTQKETDWAFGKLDQDNSGSLDYGEITKGLDYVAAKHHYKPTKADWAWVAAEGKKIDTHNPGKVDKKEFFTFSNAVAEHFHICPAGLAEVEVQGGCLSREETDDGFHHIDTNHNGSLSYKEIEAALKELAAAHDYTPTKKDWAWVVKTGKKIDSKNPGKVDEGEFFHFANAVAEHFHLCHA